MSTVAGRMEPVGRAAAEPVRRLVAQVRAAWRRAVLLRGLAVAPSLLAASALALLALDLVVPLPADARSVLRWVPVALAVGAAGWVALRIARPPADRRLALLAEERVPALENRLVTALEMERDGVSGVVGEAFLRDVGRRLAEARMEGVAPVRLRAPSMVLVASAALLALFALALPGPAREAWARWSDPVDAYPGAWADARAEVLPAVPEPPVPGLDELRWRVEPPAYAGLAATEGRGDEPLSALPGSRVTLRSRWAGRWSSLAAERVGGGALPVERADGEWRVGWTVGPQERGVTLAVVAEGDTVDRAVVPVSVLADRPPDVALLAPEADLVLPSAHGRVPIRATAADDHGVAELRLTWIRSRGSGELFEFVEGEWPWAALRREGRSVAGEVAVDLATLGLEPGDVLHLRAVARDRNDVTGPGESVSRTRMIRIAREGELADVTAVFTLPPQMPKDPVLSQRMLVLMTERLRDRAPRLPRHELEHQAAEVAREQGRLRERVGEQIFTRATGAIQEEGTEITFEEVEGPGGGHAHGAEEGAHAGHAGEGESPESLLERASEATGQGTLDEISHRHDAAPILDVNRTLLTLYNLMWSAERELGQAAPAAALPPQYRALELIQSLQTAERVFARGQVRVDPIDPAAARGEGKVDDARPAPRTAAPARPTAAPLLAEVDRVAASFASLPPRDASFALSGLAARVLDDPAADRQAAQLLSRAASAAGAGRRDDAAELLRRARGLLAPGARTGAPPLPASADPAAADYFRRLGRGGSP